MSRVTDGPRDVQLIPQHLRSGNFFTLILDMEKSEARVIHVGIVDTFWTILVLLLPLIVYRRFSRNPQNRIPSVRSVAIIVLGDVGRSPRMMYHAESFARASFNTYLIGYPGKSI